MGTTFTARPAQAVNATTAGDQVGARIATLPNGGHMVAWNSGGNIMAQAFDASGAKVGGELTLLADRTLGGIAALADGSLVVSATRSWVDPNTGPRSELSYERITASGQVLVPQTLVDNTGNYDVWVSGGNVFALPGGGFALTDVHTTRPVPWSSVSSTLQVYDAANHATGTSIAGTTGYLQQADEMRSGGFVMAANTNFGPSSSVFEWRTTDAAGNTVAQAKLMGQYGVNDYYAGGAAALADGRAIVAWNFTTYAGGTTVPHWQAQWIDASGHPTGGVFALDVQAPSTLRLEGLADGGFLATWTQQSTYGAPTELYAKHFDNAAQADSDTVHLATLGNGSSLDAYTIEHTADGGFLLAMQRAGDGMDVWEQEFDFTSSNAPTSSGTGHISVSGGIMAIPDGDYTISGTAGLDQIAFASAHTAYTISQDRTVITGPEGVDQLAGIERVRFSDGYAVALDITGHAGQAYRLYQAAFDRAPDIAGLGFQANDLDMGYSMSHVAQNFIDSPEFQSKYGNGLDNTQFITLLYQHVLHRDPEAAGLQYHLDEFAHGDTRADMLTHFSESPENQANVVGQIANGMLYIPYA